MASLDDHMLYLNRAGRVLVGQEAGAELLPDTGGYLMPESRGQMPAVDGNTPVAPWRGRLHLMHTVTKEPIEVDATLSIVRDGATGTPLFRAVVMRDTRERSRLRRRLDEHVERMPVALITVDSLGHILGWNPAAEVLLGHPEAAALGMVVQDLVSAPELLDMITSDGISDHVVEVSSAAGDRLMVEWSAITLETPGGGARDMMLVGRDMSAQLRAEHERREALRAAAMATWTADCLAREPVVVGRAVRACGSRPARVRSQPAVVPGVCSIASERARAAAAAAADRPAVSFALRSSSCDRPTAPCGSWRSRAGGWHLAV